MKIGVAGAGAVGCFFGALLSKAGHEVIYLARGSHYETMKMNKLQVDTEAGLLTVEGEFTDLPKDLGEVDLVLFCVKSTATKELAEQLHGIVKKSTLILTMQNGVENEEILSRIFGINRMISSATYVQALIESPGKIKQRGNVQLVMGPLDFSIHNEVMAIVKMFQQAGVHTTHSDAILEEKWKKFVWNATFNPLSAVSCAEVGEILDDPNLRKTAETLCMEVIDLAIKSGIKFDKKLMVSQIFLKSERARGHRTSMLQDRLNGKRMEVEALCGFIVRKGAQLNIATPAFQTVFSILNYIDDKIEHPTSIEAQ
ncbi:ketopantoate reductase family protein [Metabacillus herbersteinensis]|uniref:2-dehydropantoate 2-reductase n=1 Tax=Metabacillus herbersteinensis TaxID=283816 RepID=A0ABV6GJM2_9BACI